MHDFVYSLDSAAPCRADWNPVTKQFVAPDDLFIRNGEFVLPHRLWSLAAPSVLSALFATLTGGSLSAQADSLAALGGVWIYVEDRTQGRALERLGPPMSSSFSMRVESDAVILTRGHGSGHTNVRVPLDGTVTEVADSNQVERDSGLVYVAQPNGSKPTEFVHTELTPTRAVFANPRHNYPKRIVYLLSAEGVLTATIACTMGGTLRGFEFRREGK